MTFLRRVAKAISQRVVRWAVPGCKEWAEGLAREIEFIEGDWRALFWAIGSARVLLERRSASADAKRRWPEFLDWSGWVWYGSLVFDFAIDAAVAKNWQVRVGSALVAFAFAYFGASSVIEWLRKGDEPSEFVARTLHARALLMRKLARSRTMRRWISPAVTMVGWFGFLLAQPHIVWWKRELEMVLVIAMGSIRQEDSPKSIEARIAHVDARLARYEAQRVSELSERAMHTEVPASPTFSRLFRRRRQSRRRALR